MRKWKNGRMKEWKNERMKDKSNVKWNERMRKWMKEWESKCKIKKNRKGKEWTRNPV